MEDYVSKGNLIAKVEDIEGTEVVPEVETWIDLLKPGNLDFWSSWTIPALPGAPLPLSALRLLVPPIQLVSAAIWQTVQQRVVADYGMLEEFISMVTDIVPQLINSRQRAQLTLGLRARLILELCQFEATADFGIIQPHLDRMHILTEAWVTEAGAANMDEQPNSDFVNLVKNLLNNPEERERFFQKVFIEEFGPTYDDSLHTLTWLFLSRLEKFLPLQTFQQVAAMFGETSSVLEGCIESVSQCEELRTLLQYQKDLSQLDHNDGSLDGTCIITALKLPSIEGTMTEKPQLQTHCLHEALSGTSELEKESLALPYITQTKPDTITQDQTSQINPDKTNWVLGENRTAVHLGEIINHEENFDLLQSQEKDTSRLLKECSVLLKRLDNPASSQSRPVRRNRGLRMKMILLEEKRGCHKKDPTTSRTKPSNVTPPEISAKDSSSFSKDSSYMAPISNCSEDDSWSYYSDQGSCHKGTISSPSMADSWSNYSDDVSFCGTPVSNSNPDHSLSTSSNEDLSLTGPREDKDLSATSRKQVTSDIKAGALKKTRKVVCFICKEQVKTKLRIHMKTHFPNDEYACPRCDSRFKVLTSFRLHLKRTCFEHSKQQVGPDEAQNLYKCDKCEEAFRYKLSLEVHKQTHNELYCSVCRKVLRDAAALARHKASHTMLQCPRCEETFTLYKPLMKHCENVHKISRPYKCNHCPKTYSRLRILIGHEWKHTGHLPFRCARCGLRFRSDADLLSHGRVHTGERPYLCAECGKTFSQKSNLVRHLHFIHSDSRNEKKHSCSECGKSFKEKGALKKHQKSKHYKELFRHPCQYCGKMFSASSIVRHKLIHTGERPFKCTVPMCEKYFRSTSEVKKHVLLHHTTERPYKCDVCGKGFIKMGLLNTHSKIHSGEKPFVCHFCGKAFHKLYGMQRHKKLVHTFLSN